MIVAITGIILILFVIGHLLGNLQIFLGPDWINGYSQHLRDLGPLLWLVRIFLLLTVIVHIYVTIQLAIENRSARPDRYIDRQYVKATFASRHMVVSGLIVLAFIIYHLAHFTVRVTDRRFGLLKADPLGHYDVYLMMVYGFQSYLVSGFYLLGLFLLALHLSHGSSSFFQSLGLNDKKLTPRLAVGGRIFAWLLFAGYASIPVAILLGLVKPAQQLRAEENPNPNIEYRNCMNADNEKAKPYDLQERTALFAKQSRAFVKRLPRTVGNAEDAKQFVRAYWRKLHRSK